MSSGTSSLGYDLTTFAKISLPLDSMEITIYDPTSWYVVRLIRLAKFNVSRVEAYMISCCCMTRTVALPETLYVAWCFKTASKSVCFSISRSPNPSKKSVDWNESGIQDSHCTNSAGVHTIKVALCFSSRDGLAVNKAKVVIVLPSPIASAFRLSEFSILSLR